MSLSPHQAPAPAPELAPAPRGWWRRNIIALVNMVAALALVIGATLLYPDNWFWKKGPLRAVPVTAGVAVIDGVQLSLEEMSKVEVLDFSGKPLALPAGTIAWKAVIAIQAPNQDKMSSCRIFMEDKAGDLYTAGPSELGRGKGVNQLVSCSGEDRTSTSYSVTAYFLAPALSRPVAIRINWITSYPDYVRLPATVQ